MSVSSSRSGAHSVATTNLTPAQARDLFDRDDFFAWCVDQLYQHADRLMNGAPVGVVEVPVVDLDAYRLSKEA